MDAAGFGAVCAAGAVTVVLWRCPWCDATVCAPGPLAPQQAAATAARFVDEHLVVHVDEVTGR